MNARTQKNRGLISRLQPSVSSVLKKVLAQCRPSATVSPKIVLLVISLWLSLILCELGLRLFIIQSFPDFKHSRRATLGYRYHRRYGWFPVPKGHTTFTFGTRPISIINNSKGLRDIEPVQDGRPGVLFLGDSFVWGYNVQAGERFTEKLRQRHPEWQVYNVGVVGLSTKLRVSGGWHWSPEGHTYVADKIDQFLSARQFLPRGSRQPSLARPAEPTRDTRMRRHGPRAICSTP